MMGKSPSYNLLKNFQTTFYPLNSFVGRVHPTFTVPIKGYLKTPSETFGCQYTPKMLHPTKIEVILNEPATNSSLKNPTGSSSSRSAAT